MSQENVETVRRLVEALDRARIGELYTFRKNELVRVQVFGEREKALAAAGLSE